MRSTEEAKALDINCVQPNTSILSIEDKKLEPVVWLIHKILLETEGGVV